MSPRVTALRCHGRSEVGVEVDGVPWRRLHEDVVVRSGLAVGVELDRPRIRALARARRSHEAIELAARALRRRDHSSASLRQRLESRGVAAADREATVAMLARLGVLDDGRSARARADALARRGYGDAAIEADLQARGYGPDVVASAVAALPREPERAAQVLAARGAGPRTLRALASRGFSDDVLEPLIAEVGEDEIA